MDQHIDSKYADILDVLEVKPDIPAEDYYDLCKEAADMASHRMVMDDEVNDQLYFPNDGVPGLNDIAHALVTGFMQMGEDSETITQDMYPDLVRLFFIAGDYSDEYRVASYMWMLKMTPEQANAHPELLTMWMRIGNSNTYLPNHHEELVRLSGHADKLPLIQALNSGNDDEARKLSDSVPLDGTLPGWNGFPFTACAVKSFLLRL